MSLLVTGAAGFIGNHVAESLLKSGHHVIGLDNLNAYYSRTLKRDRIKRLDYPGFEFYELDLTNKPALDDLLLRCKPSAIIHLAAQPGVRHSLTHPADYVSSNLVGFVNLLEGIKTLDITHFMYASTSSVYGANAKYPYSESDRTDTPLNLYAATKKANEAIAYSYSSIYDLPCTGMRFFTVYGPWGRPDMAPQKFIAAIKEGRPLRLHNFGDMRRDFTYIDDIVNGITLLLDCPPRNDTLMVEPSSSSTDCNGKALHRVVNIGRGSPTALLDFVSIVEQELGIEAKKELVPIAPGEAVETYCCTSLLRDLTGFMPQVSLKEGIRSLVEWNNRYYG